MPMQKENDLMPMAQKRADTYYTSNFYVACILRACGRDAGVEIADRAVEYSEKKGRWEIVYYFSPRTKAKELADAHFARELDVRSKDFVDAQVDMNRENKEIRREHDETMAKAPAQGDTASA